MMLAAAYALSCLLGGTARADAPQAVVPVYLQVNYDTNITSRDGMPLFEFPWATIEDMVERGTTLELRQSPMYVPNGSYKVVVNLSVMQYTSYDRSRKGKLRISYEIYYKDTDEYLSVLNTLCYFSYTQISITHLKLLVPFRDQLRLLAQSIRAWVKQHMEAGQPLNPRLIPGTRDDEDMRSIAPKECRHLFGYDDNRGRQRRLRD